MKTRNRRLQFYAEISLQDRPDLQQRYPDLQWIQDYRSFRKRTMHEEKQSVIFARKRGPWLKPFHCYYHNSEYRYYSLDLAEGCLFDCVYCYLQTYLNHGALVIFVDAEKAGEELTTIFETEKRPLWISTGLLSDSLLAESIFPIVDRLAERIPVNSILELRTKSANLDSFQHEPANDRVVISWSLNPTRIAQTFEYGAASPEQRLQAAAEAAKLGYRIAFHLDPVFHYEGWQQDYEELFTALHRFAKADIAFFSLGLFRFMPDLGKTIRLRFPYHPILTGEFFMDRDGKYHYFRAIRKEMYRRFRNWLAPWVDSVPIFWSMEPDPRLLKNDAPSEG